MIELSLKINGELPFSDPFVGVVGRSDSQLVKSSGAKLLQPTKQQSEFQIDKSKISFNVSDLTEGEVLLIFPNVNLATRFYRPGEKSNTILLTERCDQYCTMCSQPPKSNDFTHWELYSQACCQMPDNQTVGISGGEPTLYKKDLFKFLEQMKADRPDLRFHVLTNAQHFEEADKSVLKRLNEYVVWGVPLYAHQADIHDQIVGKSGAFEKLFSSFSVLLESEARVELRTVLLKQNLHALPFLAKEVAKHFQWIEVWSIMQLEQIGFARIDWETKFEDTSVFFDFVADALLISQACGLKAQLFNFPHCTVPEIHRSACVDSIADWKKKYLHECEGCAKQGNCCGFFEWYKEETGFSKIERLKA